MDLFWIDAGRNHQITYKTFVGELTKPGQNNIYIKNVDPYKVYVQLIRNFLNDKKSTILDADFSIEELSALGLSDDSLEKGQYDQKDLKFKFPNFAKILAYSQDRAQNLEIDIYTSGTTGRPKSVSQSLTNLTRAVKIDKRFKDNRWAFAYNPTHFAGLQVFFQALFNNNVIVFVFQRDFKDIYRDLRRNKVTHLSCTPTFMKLLLGSIEEPLYEIKVLTFGGERFDPKILDRLANTFPNAKINNIYASTEAGSLLRGEGEYFSIPSRYKHLIKIEKDELLIHSDLLGKSHSFVLSGNWYHTGDIVEYVDRRNRFKFKNRGSDLINVGGYKVNPAEVESVIKKVSGVSDVLVVGRKNSLLGNVIVAEVITNGSLPETEIKNSIKLEIRKELQEYKMPHKITFVESFQLSRTGKVKRI